MPARSSQENEINNVHSHGGDAFAGNSFCTHTINFRQGDPKDNTDIRPARLDAEACLRSLGFSNLDARHNDIADVHPGTCDWFFTTDEFCKWQAREDLSTNNGVLWLKGKPGAGKSTLMKHVLKHCKDIFNDQLVVAHFFNARGDQLEKTCLGMLRSVVYQLVLRDNAVRSRFDQRFREKEMMH